MQNSIGLVMKLELGEVGGSDNLVEVRGILETEIAALAAARATEKEIAAMREAIASDGCKLERCRYFYCC